MFRIRKVSDDLTPANRDAIAEAQRIFLTQFPGIDASDIEKLPSQLRNPLKHRFVAHLFVANDGRDRVLGVALLLHAPDLNFSYLEIITAAPGGTGRGVGAALYDRVREEARALGASGIFFECLPDDPALSPNEEVRKQNAQRLKFYERYGARPIVNTAYETSLNPGETDPPYLVLDTLGSDTLPRRDNVRKIVRAILERKYGHICPPAYIDMVVKSIADDPVRLREPRYVRPKTIEAYKTPVGSTQPPIVLVFNHQHDVHHVHDRGYVEAPARVRAILGELQPSGLFQRVEPKSFPDRHIREVHDGRLVDYIRRACALAGSKKSIYPYVFPVRNATRPPKEQTVLAGYYCIDTFTPLNEKAYLAARRAVDCALTAAEKVLEGQRLAYALVRPPGHHAESKVFGGFCYFNNAAVAAQFLSRYGRVAILDIDYHHGNGQQDIFYQRADVLTVSIHGHPSFAYPYYSGFRDETGIGPGAGYNLNLPLAEHATPDEHRAAVATGLRRIRRFDPAFLIVAAGFDTAKGDPTGTWRNGARDFSSLGKMIGETGYPTLIVQEGGYLVRTLGANVRNFFAGMADAAARTKPKSKPTLLAAANGPVELSWRRSVHQSDIGKVGTLVAATGYFSGEETAVAVELVEERIKRGPASGYEFLFAEDGDGKLAGYACWGPISGAPGRFDLYWIVVDRGRQRGGIGRQTLARAEEIMVASGTKRVYVDTSGRDLYASTRAFYRRTGYRKAAELSDFYGPGDAKVIFIKDLAG